MLSSQLSQAARDDFNIVLKMAQSIGLADHPPCSINNSQFIANSPPKKSHKRRCHHSDLLHFQREERAKKVRERHSSLCERSNTPVAARKGSVMDVYCKSAKPYEDPQKYFQTQKILLKKDMSRLANISRNSQRVKMLSQDKKRRSKILCDISEGVITVSEPPKRYTTPMNFFRTKKTKVVTPCTASQSKLLSSFDYSKFQVVPRIGGLDHLSRESTRTRKVQTARNGKRPIDIKFNPSNKAELIYNNGEESQAWFECC